MTAPEFNTNKDGNTWPLRAMRPSATFQEIQPYNVDNARLAAALDVLEAPWHRRDEGLRREQFRDRTGTASPRSLRLMEWILATGLERFEPSPPLPPISEVDVPWCAGWLWKRRAESRIERPAPCFRHRPKMIASTRKTSVRGFSYSVGRPPADGELALCVEGLDGFWASP